MHNGKISKNLLLAALLAAACAPLAVQAQSTKSSTEGSTGKSATTQTESSTSSAGAKSAVSAADQKTMRELAYANMSEVEAGKLALEKSQNEQVKSFAQKMIDDHTKAQKELQQLAQSKGVALPDSPDLKHKAMSKVLGALSGDAFDRRYMAQGGLNDHQSTHKLLQEAQGSTTDPALKQLVAKMLPKVDQHLADAQQLQASIKSSGNTASGASGTAGSAKSDSGSGASSSSTSK